MRSPRVIILLALAALLMAASACGGSGDDDEEETATPEGAAAEETPGGSVDGAASELARAVVIITPLDSDGDPVWNGSGTIISKDGIILTNAHVVEETGEWETLAVGITSATDEPPEVEYAAEILAIDYALDFAVVRIEETLDGDPVTGGFPFVQIGDSDAVDIGDDVQILGYPGIGGETITFTRGVVSGFTAERLVGGRAWIKTDATIAGGNSGGLAVNADGEIIGVPTVVGAGAEADYVDCRVLEDTNNDGFLDDDDNCVTVGGFINGLRPVNLALDLIESAESGEDYISPYYETEIQETPTGGGFDTEGIDIENIVFSPGVTENDQPTEALPAIPSFPARVCAFWDYSGMEDGMSWEAVWYIDGEINEEGSIIDDTWVGGESGNWWVCVVDESGLADGLYEVVISVEAETQGSEAIFVGGDREFVSFYVDNESSTEICAAWVSPSGAENWGTEHLGATVTLMPSDAAALTVATGAYDILLLDCDGETVLEEYDIEISEDSTYTVTE